MIETGEPQPGGRHRRARGRWFIQLGRRLRRQGVCPCGEKNPAYLVEGLDASCGGSGMLQCRCGGDQCVCHHHGETECPGCPDCDAFDDDDDWTEDDGDSWEPDLLARIAASDADPRPTTVGDLVTWSDR